MGIVVVIAVLVLGGVLAFFGWKAEQKRRAAILALAREIGWQFDPTHDRSHDEEYAHFEIFRKGHSRVAMNTLRGTVEVHGRACPAKMGDFRYKVTTHSKNGTRTHTYRFSYLIVDLPYLSMPDLLVRREGVFDKIAGVFGFDDIDFESVEFSRRFFVKSPDKRFAYDVIDPRMMEFLLETAPPCVDIEHARVCLSDGRKRWEPAEFRSQFAWVSSFFDRWPEHVKSTLESLLTPTT